MFSLTKKIEMSSLFCDSVFQSSKRAGKSMVWYDSDSSGEEDDKIYSAVKTQDARKLFNAVICLTSDVSTPVCRNATISPETFTLDDFSINLFAHHFNTGTAPNLPFWLRSMNSMKQLVRTEILFHGPDFLRGIILLITCLERPEKIDLIHKLLDFGCDINATDYENRNILHRLVHKDFSSKPYQQVTELLIKKGIDMTTKNKDDETPMEYAIMHGNLELLRVLLRHGDRENMVSDYYKNVAHFAFRKKKISSLRVIIKFYLLREMQGRISDETIMNFIRRKALRKYYKRCLRDLDFLKLNIVNTNVSPYDILTKPNENVVNYMRNNEISLEIQRIINEDPDLGYDMAEIRDKALIRRDLEDVTEQILEEVFNLPEVCSKKLFSYLDDDTLKNLFMIQS